MEEPECVHGHKTEVFIDVTVRDSVWERDLLMNEHFMIETLIW